MGGIAPERLVFLDECGVLTGMARLYGRGPRGERARAAVPHGPWARLSVLGALGHGGMLAAMSVEAATTGAVFHAYLEQVLLPELRRSKPDAVLVMDNLGAHKRRRCAAAGPLRLSLPLPALLLAGSEPDRAAWPSQAELRRVARGTRRPTTALPPPGCRVSLGRGGRGRQVRLENLARGAVAEQRRGVVEPVGEPPQRPP